MITLPAIRALNHLVKIGHKSLAKRMHASLVTGRPTYFKDKNEYNAFNIVRGSLSGPKVFKTNKINFGDEFTLRREAGLGVNAYGRSIYGQQKNVPVVDIDLKDPTSHAADQIIFNTLSDFTPALKNFMKTKRGKQSAFKIYRTPAGMRLFDVSKISRKDRPDYYEEVFDALGADPYYAGGAKSSFAYNTRLHPKAGRKTNIWNLPGNVRTGKFAKENPGDFVAKQKKPGAILKGPDADIDPRSVAEVNLYHDMLIRGILDRVNKREGRVPGLEGLMALIK